MKLSIFIILIPTPDFPHISYMLGGNLGSLLYGDVSVMLKRQFQLSEVSRGLKASVLVSLAYSRLRVQHIQLNLVLKPVLRAFSLFNYFIITGEEIEDI